MPKLYVSARKITDHGKVRYRVCIPAELQATHKATRRFFSSRTDAEQFAKTLNESRQAWSSRLLALSEADQGRVLRVLERLSFNLESLEQAAEIFMSRTVARNQITVEDAAKAFFQDKLRQNCARSYLSTLHSYLDRFIDANALALMHEITPQQISDYIAQPTWSAHTRNSAHTFLSVFWIWAKQRGYVPENPMKAVSKTRYILPAPGILKTHEVAALLRTCHEIDRHLLPYFAIGCFAGVRREEMLRMTPEHLRDGHIEIEARHAKTRSRRLIEIQPVLAEWLKISSTLQWENFRFRREKVVKASGVKWSNDCMRHSYCSYGLPIFGVRDLVLQAGHDEGILFKHYRELVRRSDCERYWNLTPSVVLAEQPTAAAAA
jgi:hypothetical protein